MLYFNIKSAKEHESNLLQYESHGAIAESSSTRIYHRSFKAYSIFKHGTELDLKKMIHRYRNWPRSAKKHTKAGNSTSNTGETSLSAERVVSIRELPTYPPNPRGIAPGWAAAKLHPRTIHITLQCGLLNKKSHMIVNIMLSINKYN
jgi:hypothetical protein